MSEINDNQIISKETNLIHKKAKEKRFSFKQLFVSIHFCAK